MRTDGIYIIKWSMIRYGTNEGRGSKEAGKDFFRPVMVICMYRALMFLGGHTVAVLTTNTDSNPVDQVFRKMRRAARVKKYSQSVQAMKQGMPGVSYQGVQYGLFKLDHEHLEISSDYVIFASP